MDRKSSFICGVAALLATLGFTACAANTDGSAAVSVIPAQLPFIGTVSDRYQSYNIEMVEVTGGRSWKPYEPEFRPVKDEHEASTTTVASSGEAFAGMDPDLYTYRQPIDLTNPRLRKLAAALGPAYVRVSGTWANAVFFPNSDKAPSTPPKGFMGVLTRPQWKGMIDFARVVDAQIITSFAMSRGTHFDSGAWSSKQAQRLLNFTKTAGGSIAAAEFMHKPNAVPTEFAPKGYNAAAYGRDFKAFRSFAKKAAPKMLILGPGTAGETDGSWEITYSSASRLSTRDILAATGTGVDVFSYHHYGAVSKRGAGVGTPQTTPQAALSDVWFARTDQTLSFYRKLRDRFEPGKPIWLTETAESACGGNPWASTFLDTFRYLDQLGRLARQGVQVAAHHTLAAGDNSLLDEKTFAPKPNYWAALLWRRLMGTTVLATGVPLPEGFHVYAHNLRDMPGGVVMLVINNNLEMTRSLSFPVASVRYTLSSKNLQSGSIQLNGVELKLGTYDNLPSLSGDPTPAGTVVFKPATITFLAFPQAGNAACQ